MEYGNLEIYFLTPFLPHHASGNALCAQGVPDWGPRLKTRAASVGLNEPSQVASVVPRACAPHDHGFEFGQQRIL